MIKRILLIIVLLLAMIPVSLAEYEVFGHVRTNFYDITASDKVIVERTNLVFLKREGIRLSREDVLFGYAVVNITKFNNESSTVPEFSGFIDKVIVRCEGFLGIEPSLLAGFSLNNQIDENATTVVLFEEVYDINNEFVDLYGVDGKIFENIAVPDESLMKCTSQTYLEGVIGNPDRLTDIETVNQFFIIPNYESSDCPSYSLETVDNHFMLRLMTTIMSSIRGFVQIEAVGYWLFKLFLWLGGLGIVIYGVVLLYNIIKGVAGKL